MNLNRPNMTEDVKFKDYTNKFLQTDSNPVTMESSGASCSMRIFCQKSQAISDETRTNPLPQNLLNRPKQPSTNLLFTG